MYLGFVITAFLILTFPKLGAMVRSLFISDSNSNWILDAYLGTLITAIAYLGIRRFDGPLILLAFLWACPWFLKFKKPLIKEIFTPVLLFIVIGMPLLIQGMLMASNWTFPTQFYNVDTPFTFMLAQSFSRNTGYPPELLENEGILMMYHYGYHALLSLFSDITNLNVHVIHGLFLMLWFFFLNVGLTFMLFRKFATQSNVASGAAVIILWFGYQHYLYNYLNPQTVKNLIFLEGRYHAVYPYAPSVVGLGLLLITIWLLYVKSQKSLLLAMLVVAVFPLFKIPYAPMAGVGFGITMLVFAFREKRIYYFLYLIGVFVLMMALFMSFANTNTDSPALEIFRMSKISKDFIFSLLMSCCLFLVLKVILKSKLDLKENIWVAAFILPIPILFFVVKIESVNTWQLITEIPFLALLFVLLMLVKNISYFTKAQKWGFVFVVCLIISIPVVNAWYYSARLIVDSSAGHEYCNNELLAKTLEKIPVKGTLLATNDLRYPADDFRRDGNQFQFSALFGHKMKVSNLSYLVTPEFVEEGNYFQSNLPQGEPSAAQKAFLQKAGVTHFVLAKVDSSLAQYPVNAYVIYRIPTK